MSKKGRKKVQKLERGRRRRPVLGSFRRERKGAREWEVRNAASNKLTHVYPLLQLVVNDLEQPDDVRVIALLHDSNLLLDLLLGTPKLVCQR